MDTEDAQQQGGTAVGGAAPGRALWEQALEPVWLKAAAMGHLAEGSCVEGGNMPAVLQENQGSQG